MLRIASLSMPAAAAVSLVSIFAATSTFAAGSPLGVWLDDNGRGAVEITECGGTLCGKVVWVKSKADAKGCGTKILSAGQPVGGGSWDNGWIYSPERGRKFDLALTPVGANRLRVTGYAGIKLFSEDHTWTRAPADLPRCDKSETAAKPKATPARGVDTEKAEKAATEPETESIKNAAREVITPPLPHPAPSPQTRTATLEAAAQPEIPEAMNAPPAPAATASDVRKPDGIEDGAAKDVATAQAEGDNTTPDSNPNTNRLSFDKVLKKTADGSCKLDLPWVKIKFECESL